MGLFSIAQCLYGRARPQNVSTDGNHMYKHWGERKLNHLPAGAAWLNLILETRNEVNR
jgi:hypothetical protein